jgi:hypothetical protein
VLPVWANEIDPDVPLFPIVRVVMWEAVTKLVEVPTFAVVKVSCVRTEAPASVAFTVSVGAADAAASTVTSGAFAVPVKIGSAFEA